jgi:endoglucanase
MRVARHRRPRVRHPRVRHPRVRHPRVRRPRVRHPLILVVTVTVFLIALLAVSLAMALGSGSSARPARIALFPYDRLYTLPDGGLYGSVAQLRANGQAAVAAALTTIAQTPAGIWAVGQPGEMSKVRSVTRTANREHAVPVIIAYNVPDRDACGKLSASSGPGQSGYEHWIDQLAASVGAGYDIVIVEPDALPDIVRGCLDQTQAAQRYQLLSYAMRTLGSLPHAEVYLDAGNPGMFSDPARLAVPLRRAGIQYGRGFSANVSNFYRTADVVAWSQRLEQALGAGVGAVIDTSRNGSGPYTGPDAPQWCNPPGRAPGPAPRLNPGPTGIDAYLWVKDPGASDGPCNGGPAAGQYFPGYAVQLAQAAGHGTAPS